VFVKAGGFFRKSKGEGDAVAMFGSDQPVVYCIWGSGGGWVGVCFNVERPNEGSGKKRNKKGGCVKKKPANYEQQHSPSMTNETVRPGFGLSTLRGDEKSAERLGGDLMGDQEKSGQRTR